MILHVLLLPDPLFAPTHRTDHCFYIRLKVIEIEGMLFLGFGPNARAPWKTGFSSFSHQVMSQGPSKFFN